jgi:hypothetical protein
MAPEKELIIYSERKTYIANQGTIQAVIYKRIIILYKQREIKPGRPVEIKKRFLSDSVISDNCCKDKYGYNSLRS